MKKRKSKPRRVRGWALHYEPFNSIRDMSFYATRKEAREDLRRERGYLNAPWCEVRLCEVWVSDILLARKRN